MSRWANESWPASDSTRLKTTSGVPLDQLPADGLQVERASQLLPAMPQARQCPSHRLGLDQHVAIRRQGIGRNKVVKEKDVHGGNTK